MSNSDSVIPIEELFKKMLVERYESDVQNGLFVGSFEEWGQKAKSDSEKREQELAEKERVRNLPETQIFGSNNVYNPLLPFLYQQKTFESFKADDDDKLRKIYTVIKSQKIDDCGFWLSGGVGCGKTHLMLATFNSICRQVFDYYGELKGNVKFYNYADLCAILRQDPNDFDKFQKIRSPEFLFIDDLGVSKSTDFIQEKIYSLFNYRVEQGFATFVSTNLSIKEIQSEFSDRMVSRIKESSAWVDMNGIKDYRSNFMKENMARFKGIL